MPETIGKYRIVEGIGRGGMGMIYKAHDPILDRLVALKVISPEVEVTDELRARFFREAKACAKLNHPNIVTVYDMGEDAGRLFIVMELLEGEELRRLIKADTSLTLEEKLSVMLQVCSGLHYAHQHGIVHRDMKPGNIFRLPSGRVKILDFGIAHIATTGADLTRTGLIMGTLRYISPEQLRGRADHRSDMFSVGSVFYELLTSRPPFLGDDPMQLLEQLRTEDPPSLTELDPTIPSELAVIVQRAIRKDPADRFHDLEEMRVELAVVHDRVVEERQHTLARVRRQRERIVQIRAALAERVGAPDEPEPIRAITEGIALVAAQAAERELAGVIEGLGAKLSRVEALAPAIRRANELMDIGRFEDAAVELEAIVAEMPEHRAAREGLARARRAEAERTSERPTEIIEQPTVITRREDAAVPARGRSGPAEITEKTSGPFWRIRGRTVAVAIGALASLIMVFYWWPQPSPPSPDQEVVVPAPPPASSPPNAPAPQPSPPGRAAADKAAVERAAAAKAAADKAAVERAAADKAAADKAAAQEAAAERAAAKAAADRAAAAKAAADTAVAEKAAAERVADKAAATKAAADRAAAEKVAVDQAAAEKAAAEKAAAARAAAVKAAAEKAAADQTASEKVAAEKVAAEKAAAAKAAAEKAAAEKAATDKAAAVKRDAELAAAVPPSQPLGRFGSGARSAIQQVLDDFKRAYESKDVALVQRIRPGLRSDELQTLRNTFDNATTYTLDLRVETIEMRENEAQARAFRQDVLVAKDGQIHRSEARVTVRFKRVRDRWTIDDIK